MPNLHTCIHVSDVYVYVCVCNMAGLRACLDKADEWEFNVFDLEKESDGLPLQVLCWHLFMKHNLIEEFQLDQIKFINFLRTIESGHQDNPYHNATHVADVMQVCVRALYYEYICI